MQYLFLCDHTPGCEAYCFTTDGQGIFNVLANLGACRTREWGGGVGGGRGEVRANKSAQELLTRMDRKTVSHAAPPWGSKQDLRISSSSFASFRDVHTSLLDEGSSYPEILWAAVELCLQGCVCWPCPCSQVVIRACLEDMVWSHLSRVAGATNLRI